MLRLQEDMQTSMARELHDEFGQILTAMNMLVGRAKRQLEAAAASASTRDEQTLRHLVENVEEVQAIAQQTLERIRTASRLLHPVILDDFGLEQAIAWYVDQFSRQHGIDTQFERTGTIGYLAPDASIHLYRIVQEALSNVSRHSGATRAWVRLTQLDGTLALEIEDAGRGLTQGTLTQKTQRTLQDEGANGTPFTRGIGVTSMRERAELMGGELTMTRGAGGGLLVSVRVPCGPSQVAEIADRREPRVDASATANSNAPAPVAADSQLARTDGVGPA